MGFTNFPNGITSMGVPVFGDIGIGNVYFVIQSAQEYYGDFVKNRQTTYSDGSQSIQTDIQAALDLCVADRNDYVVVFPDGDDYDITAALTMSKKCVHLVCPAGMGTRGFPTNAARIHQNTASTALFTVTGVAVEIAGLFFKGIVSGDIITLSGTVWHPHIHDNFFGMSATASSNNTGIVGTVANHVAIHDNYFNNYSPGAMTGTDNDLLAFIGITSASATRGLVNYNMFVTGHNTAVAKGINIAGAEFIIADNYLVESKAWGGSQAGTFTLGISSSSDSVVINNRISIATANNAVDGGTAGQSYLVNYEPTNGGTAAT